MSRRIWSRRIATAASLALVVTIVPAQGAQAGAPPGAGQAVKSKGKVEARPDHVSAMSTAQAQGSRVEDLGARTPSSATFANPNGTWTTEAYAGAVRSKTDEDTWVQVNTAVEKAGGGYEPKAASFDANYSAGGDKMVGSVIAPGGASIEVGWPTKLPTPTPEGDTLTYPAAAPGADLVVESRPDGFSYSMVLDQAPAADAPQVEYRVPLRFGDANVAVKNDGSIVIKDGKRHVATMTAPVMWDSAEANRDGHGARLPVATDVEGSGANRTLVLRPDMEFLRDSATVWPVVVDPTVVINASYDSWVQSSGDTSSQFSSPELRVGSNDGGTTVARSYLYFDMSAVVPGAVPVAASINLTNFATGECPGSALRMSPLISAWNFATGSWAVQPSTTTTASSLSSQAYGPGCGTQGTVSFDALGLFAAYLGGAPNFGVQIKAEDETAQSGWRKFRSIEYGVAAKAPQFVVTYNNPPNTPGATQVVPASSSGSTQLSGSSTPSFTAAVSDPDGSQVTGKIKITQGSTVVATADVGPVASGASATYKSPGLADGTYSVQWQATDGTLTSAWSTAQTVVVDSTPPAAPTITCTGTSPNTWYATAPTFGTDCTLTLGAGTTTVAATLNGEKRWFTDPQNGQSTGTGLPTPDPGVFDLQVIAADAAGNSSSVARYTFGVGGGALTKPIDGTRSVRKFVVAAAGKSGATGATAQWRLAGGTTWTTATQVKKNGATWNGVPTTQGTMAVTGDLDWYLGDETAIKNPSVTEVRFCFTYTVAPTTRCTNSTLLNLVPHAFGGSFPTSQVGPATVSLQSGEFQLDSVDVTVPGFGEDLTVSRTYQSFANPTGAQAVFGPGWVANMDGPDSGFGSARVVDNTTTNGTISLIDVDGSTANYRLSTNGIGAQAVGVYKGQGEASGYNEKLEIKNTTPKTMVLTEADTTTTTWEYTGSNTWAVKSIITPTGAPATTYSYTGPYVSGIYAGVPGVTCNATTQARGCHALLLNYSTIAGQQRLTQVDLRTWDPAAPGGAAMVTTPAAIYTYDSAGLLTASYDPREDVVAGQHLTTAYTYQNVSGRTYLATVSPPAEKTWSFNLNPDGTLDTITRPQDPAIGGTATWRIVYGVALSGTGLPNLTTAAVARWDQPRAADHATAVFGPDAPGTADMTYADITYFTADGETTNTASYGSGEWQIDSLAHDQFGNTIWSLEAGALRAGLSTGWNPYALSYMLSTRTRYNAAGTRVEYVLEPNRWVVLEDGTSRFGRPRTDYVYDDEAAAEGVPAPGRPTPSSDPNAPKPNIVVEERHSVSNWDGEAVHASGEQIVDIHKTRFRYDKVLNTDGDGWTLHMPTRTSVQLGAGWSTSLTRFDQYGEVLETRTPQGISVSDGSANDAYSTFTTYFTADGSSPIPTCRNHPEWLGLVCRTGPGASTGYVPTATSDAFDYLLNPTSVTETSGAMTRTTTTTYDAAGRKTAEATAMSGAPAGDQSVGATDYTYAPATGALTSTSTSDGSVDLTYDTWGRVLTQTDGAGSTTSSTYDDAGRLKTLADGKGTYSYTYDGTDAEGRTERRGLITKLDAGLTSGPDEFKAAYDAYGNATTVLYPNGVVERKTIDQANREQGLTYSRNGTAMFSETVYRDVEGRNRSDFSTGTQKISAYDGRGRLTSVQDNGWWTVGCFTRIYSFSLDSNRAALATSAPASGGACSTSSPTTESSTFDADSRITDSGYSYDGFGRTRTVPAADTSVPSGSALDASYFANDMVANLSQTVASTNQMKTYELDPLERIHQVTSSAGGADLRKTINHYAGNDDKPAWTDDQTRPSGASSWTSSWTRNVSGVDGDLSLTQRSDGTSRIQLANLHGDIISTMSNVAGTSTTLENYTESTEYGYAEPAFAAYAATQQYAWLGAKQRSGDTVGGLVLMGARVYNPVTGLFLSRDPVPGGNDNAYTYPVDPLNQFDLDGNFRVHIPNPVGLWKSAAKSAKTVINGTFSASASGPFGGVSVGFSMHGMRPHAYFGVSYNSFNLKKGRPSVGGASIGFSPGHPNPKSKVSGGFVGCMYGACLGGQSGYKGHGRGGVKGVVPYVGIGVGGGFNAGMGTEFKFKGKPRAGSW